MPTKRGACPPNGGMRRRSLARGWAGTATAKPRARGASRPGRAGQYRTAGTAGARSATNPAPRNPARDVYRLLTGGMPMPRSGTARFDAGRAGLHAGLHREPGVAAQLALEELGGRDGQDLLGVELKG
jgi:hypothetical protein